MMSAEIAFSPTQLGGQYNAEDAWLGRVNGRLVAILVRVVGSEIPLELQGWFLEIGFGPCRGEALMFPTLEAAAVWMSGKVADSWPSEELGPNSDELG